MGRHMDRRRFLAGVGLFTVGGAVGGGLVAEPGFAAEGPTARTSAPSGPGAYAATVMFRTSPSARLVALTFDDGPTREWTPRVLAILQRHGAKATFFRVGQRIRAAPDLVRQTAAAGHEQGNHTWAHDDLTQHGAAFARGSLERTHELLAELSGRTPTLARPPYGRIDSVGLAVCAGLHYGVTLWSQHVTGGKPHGDVDTILRRVSPGSIVLTHDGGREPDVSLMTQLDRLVASMTDRGYRFVTVSELLSAPVQGGVNHSRLQSVPAGKPGTPEGMPSTRTARALESRRPTLIRPSQRRTRAGFPCSARVRPGWLRVPSVPRERRCPHGR